MCQQILIEIDLRLINTSFQKNNIIFITFFFICKKFKFKKYENMNKFILHV